jgi:hypothetical protein
MVGPAPIEQWFADHADEPEQPLARDSGENTDAIPEGLRDNTLAQIAGRLRHIGLHADEIVAALRVTNQRRCSPPLSDVEITKIARSIGRYPTTAEPVRSLVGFTLADLQAHTFPARRTLLTRGGAERPRQGDLAQVHANRGDGKTWLVQTLSVIAATGESAMGFEAPHPCRVLHVDGEMASEELQDRFAKVCTDLGISSWPANLVVVAADWQETFCLASTLMRVTPRSNRSSKRLTS